MRKSSTGNGKRLHESGMVQHGVVKDFGTNVTKIKEKVSCAEASES